MNQIQGRRRLPHIPSVALHASDYGNSTPRIPARSSEGATRPKFVSRVTAVLLACCAIYATPALAQADTGTEKDTARAADAVSPSGVSYSTGSFTTQVPLLSVGTGEFPKSLSYGLWYNSGSNRYPNYAWTHNLTLRLSKTLVDDPAAESPDPDGKPHPEWRTWLWNVVLGQRSQSFEKYDTSPVTNVYQATTKTGSTLTYTGTAASGYHTYTGSRGESIKFVNGTGVSWEEPDGTTLSFQSSADGVSIQNNRGFAIFMEPATQVQTGVYEQEVCALNLTQYSLASVTACPTGVPTAKIRSTQPFTTGRKEVSSITIPDGGVYNYTYDGSTRDGVTRRAVNCVKKPGSSNCSVTNTYDTCDKRDGGSTFGHSMDDPIWSGSRDRVTGQVFEDGGTVSYAWTGNTGCRLNTQVVMTNALNAATTVTGAGGVIGSIKDPLLRTSQFGYTGEILGLFSEEALLPASATNPEGDILEYTYDARANITQTVRKAKPGSGLADIVTSAVFPATCTNRKTCNQPTSRTDAKGAVTDYTYDSTHGGILTETGPEPSSGLPRPQTRFSYVQRYAWISNGSGGYVQAATPVWLLDSKSLCKTSAATGNPSAPCATSGDEVKTTYDYGPNSGPNNLLLRGIVEDAGGLNLRTCYGYDNLGRKISETKPKANLSSCP